MRWFTTLDGKDTEVEGGEPFKYKGQLIKPKSRTFVPSSVDDNPFLLAVDYKSTLQALPEPLRSQMLMGDFRAGIEDSEWQVIPTAWVDAAMERWREYGKQGPMGSVGIDVARGGKDRTVISTRYGYWYAPLKVYPGVQTPDGASAAGLVIVERRDHAPVHVDVISVGGSVVDHLKSNGVHVVPVNSSEAATLGATDKETGRLQFVNKRAEIWWKFRESLNPRIGDNVALPPDPELRADLCAPLWKLTPRGIQIESKEDRITESGIKESGIKSRLGRSPDKGEAVVYCSIKTPKKHPSNDNYRDHAKKISWRVA